MSGELIGKRARRRPALRRIAANLAAWLALLGRPRRFKASRLLPPRRRLALGALAGIAAGRVLRCSCSTRAGVDVRPHAAALGGRDIQRDHRLRQVRLVPHSDRRPDRARRDAVDAGGRAHHQSRARQPDRAARLSVPRDRDARPVRHHRQAPDRPRASLRTRAVRLCAVVVAARRTPACRRGMRQPPSRPRSRSARCGRRRACRCGSTPR